MFFDFTWKKNFVPGNGREKGAPGATPPFLYDSETIEARPLWYPLYIKFSAILNYLLRNILSEAIFLKTL